MSLKRRSVIRKIEGKTKVLLLLIIVFILNVGGKCGSTNKPDTIFYRTGVTFTYRRDVTQITNPQGEDYVDAHVSLLDPDGDGIFRTFVLMQKISENVFTGTLSRVFVQTETFSTKHEISVEDTKLVQFDADNKSIRFTGTIGENITIPGAYDIKIVPFQPGSAGTKMLFRMR